MAGGDRGEEEPPGAAGALADLCNRQSVRWPWSYWSSSCCACWGCYKQTLGKSARSRSARGMLRRLDWGYRQKRRPEPRLKDPAQSGLFHLCEKKLSPLGLAVTAAAIIDEERSTAGVVVSCPAFGLSPSFANRCTNQTPNFCVECRPAQENRACTKITSGSRQHCSSSPAGRERSGGELGQRFHPTA